MFLLFCRRLLLLYFHYHLFKITKCCYNTSKKIRDPDKYGTCRENNNKEATLSIHSAWIIFSERETTMTRQQSLNYLPLVGIALLSLLVVVYLFARKQSSQPEPAVARHSVEKPADDVLKYWTADRMSSARPAPMPKVTTVEQKKSQPRRQPEA
jgi:hypothetical protein